MSTPTRKLGEGSTPGDWKYRKHTRDDYFVIAKKNGPGAIGIAYDEPDAALIAKAPLLVEARDVLKRNIEILEYNCPREASPAIAGLRALLAKLDAE